MCVPMSRGMDHSGLSTRMRMAIMSLLVVMKMLHWRLRRGVSRGMLPVRGSLVLGSSIYWCRPRLFKHILHHTTVAGERACYHASFSSLFSMYLGHVMALSLFVSVLFIWFRRFFIFIF